MKANLPDFQSYAAEPIPPASSCWRCKIGAITCFVMLYPHKSEDIFTIDLAWSTHGFLNADLTIQRKGAERTRLARLWTTSQSEPWWEVVPTESWEQMNERFEKGRFYPEEVPLEDCLVRLPTLVQDAMEKLKQFGIPYLMAKAQEVTANA